MKAATFKTTSPEIKKVVLNAIKTGEWELEIGSKHQRIRHTSGRMVTFAKTSGDRDAALFLARDIRRVEAGMPGWGQSQEITHVVNMKKGKDNNSHHLTKGAKDGKQSKHWSVHPS